MFPLDWSDVLKAPSFIISVDTNRYSICERRAKQAGYVTISHFAGINRDSEDALKTNWEKHTFLPHHKMIGAHPSAVMLSHLNVWKHIIDNEISCCTIFEDDMIFHTHWNSLAYRYYDNTPKQSDMIYMGHHCGNLYPDMHISQVPVYCLNAYVVTLDGVKKLYDTITKYPYDDFGVIDMMLVRIQTEIVLNINMPTKLVWYAWNSHMFPDPDNEKYKHPDALQKDKGLVFQQNPFFELEDEDED